MGRKMIFWDLKYKSEDLIKESIERNGKKRGFFAKNKFEGGKK